jgi:quinol monooxygenase YgiN
MTEDDVDSQSRIGDESMQEPKARHYTSARWNVRAGSEKDFVKTWTKLVNWTRKRKFGLEEAIIFQEADDSRRFVSLLTWRNLEEIARWRRSPEYKRYISRLQEYCDEIQIRTLRPVARLTER